MYRAIHAHKSTLELYAEKLVAEGLVTADEVDRLKADWRAFLEGEFESGQDFKPNKADWLDGHWKAMKRAEIDGPRRGDTGVPIDDLTRIGKQLCNIPEGFNVHKTVKRFLDHRLAAIESGEGLDWATAEALAFGTLVDEGNPVRLSGQDVERGTFSQRHTVLYDQVTEDTYVPLNNVSPGQERYEVVNSMLSEEAVLGFEYGYSLAEPKALTLWEGQFGDFANGAQVVVDQFISSGERKWFRMSGLVMLLPHGYEGQGPDHSSARLERYLQLCAEDNMQVANCTTPANYFHILRRQVMRDFRKPLILMTPKSLLRHKKAVSSLAELGPESSFHRLLWDDAETPGAPKTTIKLAPDADIRRVILCSGKVYYDLLEEREKRGIDDVYLLRLEQLYPFPAKALLDELNRFKGAEIVWCQEEPKNMGAWAFVQPYIDWVMEQMGRAGQRPRYVGRPASASTATGLMRKHLQELRDFLEEAYAA
jgi:2-oxoglutarate dehydrogenase E1 component